MPGRGGCLRRAGRRGVGHFAHSRRSSHQRSGSTLVAHGARGGELCRRSPSRPPAIPRRVGQLLAPVNVVRLFLISCLGLGQESDRLAGRCVFGDESLQFRLVLFLESVEQREEVVRRSRGASGCASSVMRADLDGVFPSKAWSCKKSAARLATASRSPSAFPRAMVCRRASDFKTSPPTTPENNPTPLSLRRRPPIEERELTSCSQTRQQERTHRTKPTQRWPPSGQEEVPTERSSEFLAVSTSLLHPADPGSSPSGHAGVIAGELDIRRERTLPRASSGSARSTVPRRGPFPATAFPLERGPIWSFACFCPPQHRIERVQSSVLCNSVRTFWSRLLVSRGRFAPLLSRGSCFAGGNCSASIGLRWSGSEAGEGPDGTRSSGSGRGKDR